MNFSKTVLLKWLIPILTLLIILLHWSTDTVKPNNLLYNVNNWWTVSYFETSYIYVYLHLFAFVPVLSLSFDKKVAYYKTWRYLIPALALVAIVFWIWDIWKTQVGVWGFNNRYHVFKIINLPVEEWLFFFTFPWASVFIYECLNNYFPENKFFSKIAPPLSIALIISFLGIGLLNWGKAYTFTTFIVAGAVLLWQYIFGEANFRARFYRAFIVGLIPFVLVNGVLTGISTLEPVVVYNQEEYLGYRFITIPLDDFAYNFTMLFSITMLFEYFRNRNTKEG